MGGHLHEGVRRPLHAVQVPRADQADRSQPARAAQPARPVPAGGPVGRAGAGAADRRPQGPAHRPARADGRRPGAAAPRRPPARPLGRARDAIGAHPGRARPADSDLRQIDSHPGPLGRKNMSNPTQDDPLNLVVVSAGTSDPSSTRLLADRTAQRVAALAEVRGAAVATRVIDLRELATDVTTALTSQLITPRLQQAIDALGAADGIIAAAPVYKAGPSGIFTSFFHALDNDLLIGKPVILAATAGTARHALVVDDQMRSLFA